MATIKQIAQEVGISSSTVSIVLGGKAAERKISTATQEKIFAAAARLGYQPNMAARSLRGGSGANELVVAMFWAQDFRASMMFRFWDGLRAEIEKTARPVRLVIYPYVNDHLKESEALTSGANCHAAIICNLRPKESGHCGPPCSFWFWRIRSCRSRWCCTTVFAMGIAASMWMI